MGLHALSACRLPTSQLPAIRPECLFLKSGKVETKFLDIRTEAQQLRAVHSFLSTWLLLDRAVRAVRRSAPPVAPPV